MQMLRNDVQTMLKKDWDPTVPEEYYLKKQVLTKSGFVNGRYSGSVRMATGKMTVGSRANPKHTDNK
jgi:hypothetical protein